MIIDCPGHYTTAPPALEAWRDRQPAGFSDCNRTPPTPPPQSPRHQPPEYNEKGQIR